MNVGIIGSGNMGRAIGVRLAQSGSSVFFGARDEKKSQEASQMAGGKSGFGSIADAVASANVLLWTMREPNATNVVGDVATLNGKILIDLNNRDYAKEAKTGAWFERSIAEQLQENLPLAKVVKAFNTIGMESFNIPAAELRKAGAQTFIAGRDAEAKQVVTDLAADLGYQAVDLGSEVAAFRAAEALGDIIRLLMIDGGHGGQAHLKLITLPVPSLDAFGKRDESKYA